MLRFDDSTRILKDFAAASENEWALKGFANEIETNRNYVALLRKAQNKRWIEEWVQLAIAEYGQGGPVLKMGEELFSGTTRSPEAMQRLTRVREWPRDSFFVCR